MKYPNPLLLAAILLVSPVMLQAQAQQQPITTAPVAFSDDDVLAPDDVVSIQVGNHADLDQSVAVAQSGKITLRELGQFVAKGKTRDALQTEIQVAADKTLNNAPVFVTIRERRVQHITMDGSISAPGVYPITPGMKVLDAISAAHGLPLKPTRYTAKLIRQNKSQPLDVSKIYTSPESDVNLTLMPNDKLVFTEVDIPRRRVTVLGQVGQPSTYEADNDTTVLTLLRQAGGLSPAAALTRVTVNRGGTVIPLNLRPVLAQGQVDDAILKFRFEDGDVLAVPGVETKYQVLGQVGRPATYILPEQANVTVQDALNSAGGATQNANLKDAVIQRTENGKVKEVKVNIDSINKKGIASANIFMQPNDILFIPPRHKPGFTLQDALAPIGLLNILGFRFLGR
jgi:protein involved in polysaccharide export with SLBB domain